MSRARSNLIDGLILNPVVLDESAVKVGVSLPPVVLLGEVSQKLADRVWVDSVAAARDMTLALARTGRRRIAVLGTAEGRGSAAAILRTRGYQAALDELGIDPDDSLLIPCEKWTPQTAAVALASYLDATRSRRRCSASPTPWPSAPSACCGSRGISVPGDIAVAGFDDIADGQYAVPSLTTVSFDKRRVASEALRLLTERMADRAGEQRVVTVDYRIVERDSTAANSGRLKRDCCITLLSANNFLLW